MLEVGKIYKLKSMTYKKIELYTPVTYEHISVDFDNYFLLLEIESNDKELFLKYSKQRIALFKILLKGKVYFMPICRELLIKKSIDNKVSSAVEFAEYIS